MRIFWLLSVVLYPLVTSAATDADRAVCRAAHPGTKNAQAYLNCLDRRE